MSDKIYVMTDAPTPCVPYFSFLSPLINNPRIHGPIISLNTPMKHNENWQKMYLKYKSLPNLSSLVFFFECQTQCFSALVLGTNENYDDDFGNFDDNDGQKKHTNIMTFESKSTTFRGF